jgi:hypothetical protein
MKYPNPSETDIDVTMRLACYILITFLFATLPSWLAWYTGEKPAVVWTWFAFVLIAYTLGALAMRKYYLEKCETIKMLYDNTKHISKR